MLVKCYSMYLFCHKVSFHLCINKSIVYDDNFTYVKSNCWLPHRDFISGYVHKNYKGHKGSVYGCAAVFN